MEISSGLLIANLVTSITTLIAHAWTLYRKRKVRSQCCNAVEIEYESSHEGNIPPKIDETTNIAKANE